MVQQETQQPSKVYRGTVEEVFSHKAEIPPDSVLELKIFAPTPGTDQPTGDFGGKSVADVILEIGTVTRGPTDAGAQPDKYMRGFGKTRGKRTIQA